MDLSEEKIRQSLRGVIDPEVNLNIVDMGLVYGVTVDGSRISVEMTLTTPGCPMRTYMEESVTAALSALEGVEEVRVEIVWFPPWSPDKIDREVLEQLNQGEP